MSHSRIIVSITAILVLCVPSQARAIAIITNFIGGSAPATAVGGGTLPDVFRAAADVWELAIRDTFTVTFDFGWVPLESAGQHNLLQQGGTPNRETHGQILFDSEFALPLFIDPTPQFAEEYQSFTETSQGFGAGLINVERYYSDPTGAALGAVDLFTLVMHEIGHGLGISNANVSFISESADGDIDITTPNPYAGSVIQLATNIFGVTSHMDVDARMVNGGANDNERRLPSSLDILANAQLSQFRDLNLDLQPVPVPEPSTLILFASAATWALCCLKKRWRVRERPVSRRLRAGERPDEAPVLHG